MQGRDFFAWLSALVFFLLAVGFTSNGTVMLVEGLGNGPRNGPWAIAQAMAGVTAFGQVITAITAATTVLRDVSLRTQGIVLTTGLPWREYLVGRFLGTLLALTLIYAALPLGLLVGDAIAASDGDPSRTALTADTMLRPLLVFVLPNVLCVAAVFFAAGALSGGFPVILLVGLGFIGLWQTGLTLIRDGLWLGALIDPFGNAAMLHATGDWHASDMAQRSIPMTELVIANRVTWLTVSLGALAWTLWQWRPVLDGHVTERQSAARVSDLSNLSTATLKTLRGAGNAHALLAEFRFGLLWVLRERGFLALLLFAALNGIANGWRVAADSSAMLRALEFHTRLFGILIATIYAGELVWRDRDTRASELLDALPASGTLRLIGRSLGVLVALMALPLLLLTLAVLLPALQGCPWRPAARPGGSWA